MIFKTHQQNNHPKRGFWQDWKKVFEPKKTHKSSQVGGVVAYQSVGRPAWTPRQFDHLTREGYTKNVIVYRSVNLIAKGVASIPWRLYQGQKEYHTHPLLTLLSRPNPSESGKSLIEALMSYVLLSGNGYLEAVTAQDTVQELYALRPDRVRVVPDATGSVQRYEYTVGGKTRSLGHRLNTGSLGVMHMKRFHPLDDWYGMSPIEAAAKAIDQHNTVASHNLALLQNGGRPSGALVVSSEGMPMTQEQREDLRSSLRHVCEGAPNAGRVMVLEGDFRWQEMGLSPKDMDFIEGKKMSAREIAQAFGVPPMLVGIPGDATFSNYREARYHLWEDTILPLAEHFLSHMNQWLCPVFGEDIRLDYHVDGIAALASKREEAWSKLSGASFLTINEKRRALGYPPLKDGDQLA